MQSNIVFCTQPSVVPSFCSVSLVADRDCAVLRTIEPIAALRLHRDPAPALIDRRDWSLSAMDTAAAHDWTHDHARPLVPVVSSAAAPMETVVAALEGNAGVRSGLPGPRAPTYDTFVMVTAAAAMETDDLVLVVDPIITIDAVDVGVGAHLEQPSTPKPKPSPSLVVSCIEYFFKKKN